MPLDGSGQPEQLTTSPEDEFQPAYSADGMFLAFHQARNGYLRQLFIMPASGGDPVPVRTTTTNNISPLWAPTGQALAYNSMDAGVACIVSRKANSRSWQETSTKLFPAGTQGIQWSPDGRWIAYAINDSIAVAPSDGGSPPRDNRPHRRGFPTSPILDGRRTAARSTFLGSCRREISGLRRVPHWWPASRGGTL
jgi:Tol biopolymer transport system component